MEKVRYGEFKQCSNLQAELAENTKISPFKDLYRRKFLIQTGIIIINNNQFNSKFHEEVQVRLIKKM